MTPDPDITSSVAAVYDRRPSLFRLPACLPIPKQAASLAGRERPVGGHRPPLQRYRQLMDMVLLKESFLSPDLGDQRGVFFMGDL